MSNSFEQFGPFLIFRAIGRGGMGEVFIARTPWEENPLVAVKRLRPDVARVANFAERFRREAELAVRLHHPNVVGTFDVGSVNAQLYVASELIPGKDTGHIGDRLGERGQGAPLAVVIRVLLDILAGLAYVHSAKEPDGEWMRLVHRDITPGNVLVGYDGVARLADFGLAKSKLGDKRNLTQHGEILGTPHYLAPEVIRGEPASAASDIYGLGAVMYRVLTGIAPYQGTAAKVLIKALKSEPKPLSELRPDLPPWFVTTIHSMLDADRRQRPKDAGLLMRRIEHASGRFKLLLPHASVGRWLSALFEEEKTHELEEYEAIASVDFEQGMSAQEGTVVLAKARTESRLEIGDFFAGEHPFGDDNLDDETLLSEMLERENFDLRDETIQGAQLIGSDLVNSPQQEPLQIKLITADSDPPMEAVTRFTIDDEIDTGNYDQVSTFDGPRLSGFIDHSSKQSVEPGSVTIPHPSSPLDPNQPETLSEVGADKESAQDSLKRRSGEIQKTLLPESKLLDADTPLTSPGAIVPLKESNADIRRMVTKGATEPRPKATAGAGWYFWIGLIGLVGASLLGALVAMWATGGNLRQATPKEMAPNRKNILQADLETRYRNIRGKMSALIQQGKDIGPKMNSAAAHAADLLLFGQHDAALREIEKLEKQLESEP